MVLTRLGSRSRMVVTGDITQTDLPAHQTSGLAASQKILQHVEGIAFCNLSKTDVVRNPLVERIVAAYENDALWGMSEENGSGFPCGECRLPDYLKICSQFSTQTIKEEVLECVRRE